MNTLLQLTNGKLEQASPSRLLTARGRRKVSTKCKYGGIMYSYIIGNVSEINSNSIVLECNKIGYLIYVPNPFSYKIGEDNEK